MTTTIRDLAKWPTSERDVTVDGIIRAIGVDAQRTWLQKWETLKRRDEPGMRELYIAQVESCIGAIGLIGCLRALRVASPDDALGFARMYWQMCEDGERAFSNHGYACMVRAEP